jgi:hypothetical protein
VHQVPVGARCARWFFAERREVGTTLARPVDWPPTSLFAIFGRRERLNM